MHKSDMRKDKKKKTFLCVNFSTLSQAHTQYFAAASAPTSSNSYDFIT